MKKNCDICSIQFDAKMSIQKRCSAKCRKEYHRRWMFERVGDKSWRKEIPCLVCKTQFMPRSWNSTICSRKCGNERSRLAMAEKFIPTQRIEKSCIVCGNAFVSGRSQKTTCSEFCCHKNKIKNSSHRPYRKKPKFKMYQSMRVAVNTRIKAKNVKTNEMCDYTPEQLRAHLENQFRPGMTWENYGRFGWHVDHKRPISSFDFFDENGNVNLEEIRKCMALDNLQPLWRAENLIKSNKYNAQK